MTSRWMSQSIVMEEETVMFPELLAAPTGCQCRFSPFSWALALLLVRVCVVDVVWLHSTISTTRSAGGVCVVALPPCGAASSMRSASHVGLCTILASYADPVANPASSFPAATAAYVSLLAVVVHRVNLIVRLVYVWQ